MTDEPIQGNRAAMDAIAAAIRRRRMLAIVIAIAAVAIFQLAGRAMYGMSASEHEAVTIIVAVAAAGCVVAAFVVFGRVTADLKSGTVIEMRGVVDKMRGGVTIGGEPVRVLTRSVSDQLASSQGSEAVVHVLWSSKVVVDVIGS